MAMDMNEIQNDTNDNRNRTRIVGIGLGQVGQHVATDGAPPMFP